MTGILVRSGLTVVMVCGLLLASAVLLGYAMPPSEQMALAVTWGAERHTYRPLLLLADVQRGITGPLDPYIGDLTRVEELVWSPDGRYLAFAGGREDYERRDIYVLDMETYRLYRQTDLGARSVQPAWSPDGTQIAFTSNHEGESAVYVVPFEAGSTGANADPVKLIDTRTSTYPHWTPDGEAMLFFDPASETGGIMRFDFASRRIESLARWPGVSKIRMSLDGQRIAFLGLRQFTSPGGRAIDLILMDANGDEIQTPSLNGNPVSGGAAPAWSPDSATIAFSTLELPMPSPMAFRTAIYAFVPDRDEVASLFALPLYSRVHSLTWRPE